MNPLFPKKENINLDISWSFIFKIVLTIFVVYFLYIIKTILVYVLFGLIVSILLGPAIDFLHKLKLHRTLATFLVYISVFGFIGLMIYSVSPIFISEIQHFSQNFQMYFDKVSPLLSGLGFDVFQSTETFTAAIRDWLIGASASIISSVASIFGGILLTLTVFTIAIFFSLEEKGIEKFIVLLFPKKYESTMLDAWKKTQRKISAWFGARFLSMLLVGILVAFICMILGIRYPILFGILAAAADIVPFIGPIVSGSIVTLFALSQSVQTAIIIAVAFVIIHSFEANIIMPILSVKLINLPAVLVIISLLIGETLWGPIGAILAIPLFGIFYDFTVDYLQRNKD